MENRIEKFLSTGYIGGSSINLGEIVESIKDKWGNDSDLDNFEIELDERKVRGCGCCYDPGDYDYFLIINKKD